MSQPSDPPAGTKRASGESSHDTLGSKILLLIIDKLLLAVLAAVIITCFQNRARVSEERLEKARRIGDILVDRPVSIVAELPAHLDAFILYAEQIRSHDVESISSARLTELQATIKRDIDGSRAYHSCDPDLKSWAGQIKKTIGAVRAKALSTNFVGTKDLEQLEGARDQTYRFYHRIIKLSVQRAQDQSDTADEPHCPP